MKTRRLGKGLPGQMTTAPEMERGGEDAAEVRTWKPRRSSFRVMVALSCGPRGDAEESGMTPISLALIGGTDPP